MSPPTARTKSEFVSLFMYVETLGGKISCDRGVKIHYLWTGSAESKLE